MCQRNPDCIFFNSFPHFWFRGFWRRQRHRETALPRTTRLHFEILRHTGVLGVKWRRATSPNVTAANHGISRVQRHHYTVKTHQSKERKYSKAKEMTTWPRDAPIRPPWRHASPRLSLQLGGQTSLCFLRIV